MIGAGAIVLAMAIVVAALAFGDRAAWGSYYLQSFAGYLAATIRRNYPLPEAIKAYADDNPRGVGPLKYRVLDEIVWLLEGGVPLSEALDGFPEVFPVDFRAAVRVGERAGNLGRVLSRLAEAAEAHRAAFGAFGAVVMYPLLLALMVMVQLSFLVTFIVPRFQQMWADMGMLDYRAIGLLHYLPTAAALLLVVMGFAAFMFLPTGRLRAGIALAFGWLGTVRSWLRWHLPLLRRYERRRAVSRFALAMSSLLEAGVPLPEALSICSKASGNGYFDRIAQAAAGEVSEGGRLSEALTTADRRRQLPPEFLWYVEIGEASGRLPDALWRASESALMRSESALKRLVSLLPPICVLLVGVFVGFLVVVMFGALCHVIGGF